MQNLQPMKKLDGELQIVWGEVYAPDIPDSQGDFMTAPEIQKMAYKFAKSGRLGQIDVNHDNHLYGCIIVESFVARDGDDMFIPGSWVIGVHIPDPVLWSYVKSGELNGFSMQGLAVPHKTTIDLEIPAAVVGETDEVSGHVHIFKVKFAPNGEFLGGETDLVSGHMHKISRGTITDDAEDGHHHRFSFVEDLLYAQN